MEIDPLIQGGWRRERVHHGFGVVLRSWLRIPIQLPGGRKNFYRPWGRRVGTRSGPAGI